MAKKTKILSSFNVSEKIIQNKDLFFDTLKNKYNEIDGYNRDSLDIKIRFYDSPFEFIDSMEGNKIQVDKGWYVLFCSNSKE